MSDKFKNLKDLKWASDFLEIPSMSGISSLAIQFEQRRELAKSMFGGKRATEVEVLAREHLSAISFINPLNAFELAIQIESEWSGELEDVLERAQKLAEQLAGTLGETSLPHALTQVILAKRSRD